MVLGCLDLQANLVLSVDQACQDQRVNRLLRAMAARVPKYVWLYISFFSFSPYSQSITLGRELVKSPGLSLERLSPGYVVSA